MKSIHQKLLERFGEQIGVHAGEENLDGVRDEREDAQNVCEDCGMLPEKIGSVCECFLIERKKKGPSKKTAKKILRGTKTFKQKMKKVEKWADNPAAAAAWLQHKATGEWPSKDD